MSGFYRYRVTGKDGGPYNELFFESRDYQAALGAAEGFMRFRSPKSGRAWVKILRADGWGTFRLFESWYGDGEHPYYAWAKR